MGGMAVVNVAFGALDAAGFAAEASSTVGSGNAYSVAFETTIPDSVLGRSYGSQFQAANRNLVEALESDPEWAKQMQEMIPETAELTFSLKSSASYPVGDFSLEGAKRRCFASPNCSLSHWFSALS